MRDKWETESDWQTKRRIEHQMILMASEIGDIIMSQSLLIKKVEILEEQNSELAIEIQSLKSRPNYRNEEY